MLALRTLRTRLTRRTRDWSLGAKLYRYGDTGGAYQLDTYILRRNAKSSNGKGGVYQATVDLRAAVARAPPVKGGRAERHKDSCAASTVIFAGKNFIADAGAFGRGRRYVIGNLSTDNMYFSVNYRGMRYTAAGEEAEITGGIRREPEIFIV